MQIRNLNFVQHNTITPSRYRIHDTMYVTSDTRLALHPDDHELEMQGNLRALHQV